jgi:three-Cys-motif partner protein
MNEFLLNLPEVPNGKGKSGKKVAAKKTDAFDWRDWQSGIFPIMESHSAVKLAILRDYTERYVEILCRGVRHGSTSFRLTIVDGFAGGGIYQDQKFGSPFVIMNAIRVAEARVNEMGRNVKIKIDAHFYFVDEKKSALECLKHQILQSDFRDEIDKSIFLVHGEFEQKHQEVVRAAKKRYRQGGRVIFFLDQCGYSQVKPATVRSISKELDFKAEFIINIAVQWFNDLLRDTEGFRDIFTKMEFGDQAMFDNLVKLKEQRQADWRYMIESELGPRFWQASGCAYWSPFYIRPEQSHRGYWLLHLAPRDAARYAMASVHWKNGNSFLHYGQPGLRMLAYDPDNGSDGYFKGWAFDELTRKQSAAKLVPELLTQIWDKHKDGVSVYELVRANCNDSIADREMFWQAINSAASGGEIQLKGPKFGSKRSDHISDGDIIIPNKQILIPNLWNSDR